ncbi:MAG TPA: hypothetical protein VEU06_11880, partial [Micropepsaceae bacterium]|nr:hypothetical protein [Micropepsaceae bacterium]
MSLYRVTAGVLLAYALMAAPAAQAVPDFTGPWGRNMFNLEPPDTGPGPIINLRRLGSDAGRSVVDGDPIPLVGDYNNPILKPEAAAALRKAGEHSANGHDIPDPSNQCGAYALPYLFTISQGMTMIQRMDDIVILYTQNSQVRRVRMNATHPKDLKPTPMGDSVGHYEGDALVIDTVGMKLMPYTVSDRFGTPQSEAMHVIERYHLIEAKEAQTALDKHASIDGTTGPMVADPHFDKGLRVELTIEDSNIFTAPWRANVSYRRVIRGFNEGACAENNVDVFKTGDLSYVPTAA